MVCFIVGLGFVCLMVDDDDYRLFIRLFIGFACCDLLGCVVWFVLLVIVCLFSCFAYCF